MSNDWGCPRTIIPLHPEAGGPGPGRQLDPAHRHGLRADFRGSKRNSTRTETGTHSMAELFCCATMRQIMLRCTDMSNLVLVCNFISQHGSGPFAFVSSLAYVISLTLRHAFVCLFVCLSVCLSACVITPSTRLLLQPWWFAVCTVLAPSSVIMGAPQIVDDWIALAPQQIDAGSQTLATGRLNDDQRQRIQHVFRA